MHRGIYIGPETRLNNKRALIRKDPDNEHNVLAQFDALHLPEAYGWHSFPKTTFKNIE